LEHHSTVIHYIPQGIIYAPRGIIYDAYSAGITYDHDDDRNNVYNTGHFMIACVNATLPVVEVLASKYRVAGLALLVVATAFPPELATSRRFSLSSTDISSRWPTFNDVLTTLSRSSLQLNASLKISWARVKELEVVKLI